MGTLNDNVKPWKILSSSKALDEKWFPVRKDVVELPSGKIVDDYFVWESPHIVMTVPITADGKFVVVQQYRHAVGKILHQFPAGAVDTGETAEAAAQRELEEEAGYTAGKLVHLGTGAPYSTKLTGVMDVYLALDAAPEGQKQYDEQEESKVFVKTKEELLELLDSKTLQQTDFFAAAFLAFRYLEKL